ncbi:phenylacetate-CoA ligase [Pseudoduganella flava]|uniref:AMP-binding protein n=1 Tax=Pseudoduganella flava TaxID=871742 RepID=A0A562PEU0_9BURK|nr:AMP-binding protein [Pseudoduganella flava]QGZ38867.1 AMP-binding protein [Pseudoduganella flava]TWI42937.1 phenylacetate-CoA ligase [Pseudoduganella flava]
MSDSGATDAERYPTLTDAGRHMLAFMREHPAAPLYRNRSGNRLLAEEVELARRFEEVIPAQPFAWRAGVEPPWLAAFVADTLRRVPYYRALGAPPATLGALPIVARADLAQDVTRFVPDDVDVTRLLNFRTTGTTGHPLQVPSLPLVAARYLAYHKRALARFGVTLRHGAGQVGVILLGCQRRCFTYVSVTPTMGESGLAKLNLHPGDWRDPADRARYLDAMAPEVISGDPISFAELLRLPMTWRPKALLSVSMQLLPGLRQALAERFGCPVLDIYSMNEVGPVAVHDERCDGHLLLQPELYVEILDGAGRPVAPGARGEVVVTGGFNTCLPLLRYRTGDYAALADTPDGPVLRALSGRAPVRYRCADGSWVNNIDVTHALQALPLAHFAVHQARDGAVTVRLDAHGQPWSQAARTALQALLGPVPLRVALLKEEDKVVQYTSDLAEALG